MTEKKEKHLNGFHVHFGDTVSERFVSVAARLGVSRNEVAREALDLYFAIAEREPGLLGLDLRVYLRDVRVRVLGTVHVKPGPDPIPHGTPDAAPTRPQPDPTHRHPRLTRKIQKRS